jgi:hypothetical protein
MVEGRRRECSRLEDVRFVMSDKVGESSLAGWIDVSEIYSHRCCKLGKLSEMARPTERLH